MSLANRTIDLASQQRLVAADGTAAAPSITNDGDTNTGMFFPAADTIAFSEGGTEALRLTSTGAISVGSSGTNYGLSNQVLTSQGNTSPTWVNAYTGFKNRIINGDMRIDQRNAGASVTPYNSYTLDRWAGGTTQTGKFTIQQNAGSVTAPTGFTDYLGATSTSAYSVLTGDYFCINHAIEGYNVSDLCWGSAQAIPITLSFWVRSSLTGSFGGTLKNNDGSRSYPFSYTISAANTWEYKTVKILGDTTGTWNKQNGSGIGLSFGIGVGLAYSGTAGAWSSANYVSATGAVSVVGTNGATFYITGVQLEAGSTATDFERRPYGTELALCQRYCYVQGRNNNGHPPIAVGQVRNSTTALLYKAHPVYMRAAPSVSISSVSDYFIDDGSSWSTTSIVLDRYTDGGIMLNVFTSSVMTAGRGVILYGNAAGTSVFTVTSEL